MSSLFLSDIISRTGIDLRKILLIRHSVSDKEVNRCMSDLHTTKMDYLADGVPPSGPSMAGIYR